MTPKHLNLRSLSVAVAMVIMLAACGNEDPAKLISSAKDSIAKKDGSAALIQLKNALQQKPDAAEARFLLGKVLLAAGDASGASAELDKAMQQGYDQDEVVPLLAEALLEQGLHKKVEERFGLARLKSPEAQARLLTVLSMTRRADGKLPAAVKALDDALKLNPAYEPALVERARLLFGEQKFDEGAQLLDKVLAKSPANAEALKYKGDYMLYAKSDPKGALALYQQAAKVRSNFHEAQSSIVRVHLNRGELAEAQKEWAVLKKMGEKRPGTLFLGAQLAMASGKLNEARDMAQKLLHQLPDNGWALELAGAIEVRANALVQAEPLLVRAIKTDPSLAMARRLLIQLYLREGQVEKAMATLPDDVMHSKDPDMLVQAGQVYLVQGEHLQAQQFFEKAAQLAPNDPDKQTTLALSKLARGQSSEAFGELQGIAARDKGVVADMALISALAQRREYDKALAAIDKLQAKKGGDPIPMLLRAQIQLSKGELAASRATLEDALKKEPKFYPAVKALAMLDVADGKPLVAQKRMEEFVAREPKQEDALVGLAQLKDRSGAKLEEVAGLLNRAIEAAPDSAAPRLALIAAQLRHKEPKRALTTAQGAVAVMPTNPAVLDAMGQAQVEAGEFNQALNTYGKLANMHPQSVGPLMRIAMVHVAAKNLAEASQALRKALEVQPDSLEAQRGLAELALRNNSITEALKVTQNIQKQRPKESIGYVMEGDILAFSQKNEQALLAYQAARDRSPNATAIVIKLHGIQQRLNKQPEANKLAENWLSAHPKDVSFMSYLGSQAMMAGQYSVAEKYFRQALQEAPQSPAFLNNLAWVLGKQGNKESLTHVEKAATLAPDNADILDTWAMLVAGEKQWGRAIELQRKAVSIQPDRPDLRLTLAKLQIQSGDKAGAKSTLNELKKLGGAAAVQKDVDALMRDL